MTADKTESRLFLRKLRVKNYKCLKDVEISFGDLTLLLGKNGAGKSAVFDVLRKLRLFIARGIKLSDLFFVSSFTRWNLREMRPAGNQEFALEISNVDGKIKYLYHVEISYEHSEARESLCMKDGKKFKKLTELLLDSRSKDTYGGYLGGVTKWSRVYEQQNKTPSQSVGEFCNFMENIVMFSPMPLLMQNRDNDGSSAYGLNPSGVNYSSWHLDLMQTDPDWANAVREKLQAVLPGLSQIRKNKKLNQLAVVFTNNGKEEEYLFSELSSGQCVLIALYTLVFGGKNRLLLLDEPDNFVMLPEIQPLLSEMECEAAEELPQIALVSHHPEAINFISPDEQVWLARNDKGTAVVKQFKNTTMLPTAELYARGATP